MTIYDQIDKPDAHKRVTCHDCGGYGRRSRYYHDGSVLDFDGTYECRTCDGNGELTEYHNGSLAKYPGGPFVGS